MGKSKSVGVNDQSLVPDSDMRPWTIDNEYDDRINKEIDSLDQTVTMMSPQAAMRGKSELDMHSKELDMFKLLIEQNPNWLDDACVDDAVLEAYIQELRNQVDTQQKYQLLNETTEQSHQQQQQQLQHYHHQQQILSHQQQQQQPVQTDEISKNKLLLRTIRDLNDLLVNKDKPIKQFFRLTGKKNERKQTLKSIRYKPRAGPAVFNVSTAVFQRFLHTQGGEPVKAKKEKKGPSAEQLAEFRAALEAKRLEMWAYQPIDLLNQDSNNNSNDMISSSSMLQQQETSSSPTSSKSLIIPKLALTPIITNNYEGSTSHSDTNNSITEGKSNSSDFTAPSSSAIQASPIKLAPIHEKVALLSPNNKNISNNDTISSPASKHQALSASASLSTFLTSPVYSSRGGGNTSYRPTTAPAFSSSSARSKSGSNPNSSRDRFSSTSSSLSSSLNKLAITNTLATSKLLFTKNQCAEMKNLKDQLMTTAGSVALNVHPDANPDNKKDSMNSMLLTKKIASETVERNRYDQTWNLLNSPGFYEAVGPEKIYKSDSHTFHTTNEAFDKAVKEVDKSLGIAGDAITKWSQNAVANRVKIFVSGGAMKI